MVLLKNLLIIYRKNDQNDHTYKAPQTHSIRAKISTHPTLGHFFGPRQNFMEPRKPHQPTHLRYTRHPRYLADSHNVSNLNPD